MKVLIIEDEEKITHLIQKVLKENGYNTEIAHDGASGKTLATCKDYNLIILDLVLPGINGIDLCKEIRKTKKKVPILMLTALNATQDIVEGLDSGANDYLVKPFKLEELLARIRALIRLKNPASEEIVHVFHDLSVNVSSKEVFRDGKKISLTAKEFALLETLIRKPGRVASKSYISEMVWGHNFDFESNVVEVYINFLRNKIDKHFEVKLIHTVVGIGYVMKVN